MRTMAASAAAGSRTTSGSGTASPKPCASRKGAIHSKPHSSGRTTRFSSRVVSRVSHAYIQRAYQSLNMIVIQFYQRWRCREQGTGGIRRGGEQDGGEKGASGCELRAGNCLWQAPLRHLRPDQPAQAEQREQRDDSLRDHAIEAPDLRTFLSISERCSAKPRPMRAAMRSKMRRRASASTPIAR